MRPGHGARRPLRAEGDEAPTVPLRRNEVPVDLDLVFASMRMPYRQRLSLIVNELGTGLAGRPRELNDAIRQANPALAARGGCSRSSTATATAWGA